MNTKETIAQMEGVNKSFNGKQVLKSIDFSLAKGEIVALLGLNGQGKTTLVRILLGLEKADSGNIHLALDKKQEIGVMLQEVAMPSAMKTKEWLSLLCVSTKEEIEVETLLEQGGLTEKKNCFCLDLSGGEKRRLQFIAALANNPVLLILDEPTVGMDIASKDSFWKLLKQMVNEQMLTILLISHDIEEVQKFATRIAIMNDGQIVLDASKEELINRSGKDLSDVLKQVVGYGNN